MAFFQYGELPLVLLAVLKRRPMNGYEALAELGRLFAPAYAPSPGSVYPAFAALSRSGLISASEVDGTRTYSLAPAGDEALRVRAGQLAAIEARTGVRLQKESELQAELHRLERAIADAVGHVDPDDLLQLLRRVRRRCEALTQTREK